MAVAASFGLPKRSEEWSDHTRRERRETGQPAAWKWKKTWMRQKRRKWEGMLRDSIGDEHEKTKREEGSRMK